MSIFTTLPWESLEDAADYVFDVWTFGSERTWAESTWKQIEAAGLTVFQTGEERNLIAARFFALCWFYLDFCKMAAHEESDLEFIYWARCIQPEDVFFADMIRQNPTLVAEAERMVNTLVEESDISEDDLAAYRKNDLDAIAILLDYDEDLLEEIPGANAWLKDLAGRERPLFIKTLLEQWGGKEKLFIALWRTMDDTNEDDEEYISDTDLLNTPDPTRRNTMDWIANGAPPVL